MHTLIAAVGSNVSETSDAELTKERRNAVSASDTQQREVHWQRTRSLMIIHLLIWFLFAYVIQWFAFELNSFKFLGFPFGYYMGAQGSLFAFVIQLFIFVKQQERVDRECGMSED